MAPHQLLHVPIYLFLFVYTTHPINATVKTPAVTKPSITTIPNGLPIWRVAYRVFDDCTNHHKGIMDCLKRKTVGVIDRANKIATIPLGDGVILEKIDGWNATEAKHDDDDVDDMLTNRIARFMNGRAIRFVLPNVTTQELSRSVEEGRGKMKKMMSMMMTAMGMKMAMMVPMMMMGMFMMAGKALVIGKIALLISSIIGLKKLVGGQKGGGESHGGWQSGGGGGYDRRAYIVPSHDLAYSSYRV